MLWQQQTLFILLNNTTKNDCPKFEFDSSTPQLSLKANGNLPDAKTIWVVPQGLIQ